MKIKALYADVIQKNAEIAQQLKEKEELAASGKGDKVEMQFELRRADAPVMSAAAACDEYYAAQDERGYSSQ